MNKELNKIRARECMAMPGERNQVVLTPELILEKVRHVFGGQIKLDPCTTLENPTNADKFYTESDDGLSKKWKHKTYVNPPFKHLSNWMEKASYENVEMIMLGPVRTHRKWFYTTSKSCDEIAGEPFTSFAFIRTIKFQGHKQAFPAPLFIAYKGPSNERFKCAFSDLACTWVK